MGAVKFMRNYSKNLHEHRTLHLLSLYLKSSPATGLWWWNTWTVTRCLLFWRTTHLYLRTNGYRQFQEFVRGDIWDSNLPVRMDGKLEMKLIGVGRKVRYTVRFSLTTAVFIAHWMWLVASLSWESTACWYIFQRSSLILYSRTSIK